MDQALAVLLGAGVGATAMSLGAPLMTSRWAAHARRRELRREVYATGLRVISEVPRATTPDDLRAAAQTVHEAQVQIRLVGSIKAAEIYNELAGLTDAVVDQVLAEAGKWRFGTTGQKRAEAAFPPAQRTQLAELTRAFVKVARHDLGMAPE